MINKRQFKFFCIGAQKAGTTSLHDILSQNPNIGLPLNKETHFFSHDDIYTNNIDDYYKMFRGDAVSKKCIGEIDPEYLCSEVAANRIYEHFGGDIKFIVVLRNPIDRAYSQYLMSKRRGFETLDFEQALKKEEERSTDTFGRLYFSYSQRSLYTNQIKTYFKIFNPENFIFIRFEDDFLNNKKQTINSINSFLELDDFEYDTEIKSNSASVPKSKIIRNFVNKPNLIRKIGKRIIPSSNLRKDIITKIDLLNQKSVSYKLEESLKKQLLNSLFYQDILELEKLTNKDFSSWYQQK